MINIKQKWRCMPLILIFTLVFIITLSACGGSDVSGDADGAIVSGSRVTATDNQPSENQSPETFAPFENDKQMVFGAVLASGDSVSVYSKADLGSKVIGHVDNGTVLARLQKGSENEFYQISYGGKAAYISFQQSVLLSGDGAEISSPSGERLIALTFDDGPDRALTPMLLDILKQEEVSVTFFVLGSSAKSYSDIIKRADDEGHQIASHTWSHKDLTTLAAAELSKEISETSALIENITGLKPTALRPPYGAFNETVLQTADTPAVLWSVDPMDWKFSDADIVYQNVVNVAQDGDIVLLHDIHLTSVQAAAKIIPAMKSRGYSFVTVDQLIERRGAENEADYYTALRP